MSRNAESGDAAVEIGPSEEITVARLSGSLAGPEALPVLKLVEDAAAGAARGIVLDLSGVDYLGSFVIGKMLALGESCRARGVTLSLAAAKRQIHQVIDVLGLTVALDYHESVKEATAAILDGQGD